MSILTRGVFVCAGLALSGSMASASVYQWNWSPGDPGDYSINNNGGAFESVEAVFNTSTNRLQYSVTFSNQVTSGFTLALNNGPNPKGHAGELALLYFDATHATTPKLTAYGYNGRNDVSSYVDGNGAIAGNQAPDKIASMNMPGWLNSIECIDHDGKRTMSFDIDASMIVGHSPMYPDAVDPWHGIGFGEELGIWMHPFRSFNAWYDSEGFITTFLKSGEGWFDGVGFQTTEIPSPGAMALAGIGLGLCGSRRRRSA